jgi:Domain of unknown function (DUF4430)
VRRLAAIVAALTALAGAGCGLGPGEGSGDDARVLVTRDFGAQRVGERAGQELRDGDTVMRVLQRGFDVDTRYGGGFVQAIDGLGGGSEDGRRVDWFFYVNGVESTEGAAAVKVRGGDAIWWDRHPWDAAMSVPAVVGSFPEPFVHGVDGRRLAARVLCRSAGAACEEVRDRLRDAGAAQSAAAEGTGDAIDVIVGPWPALRADARGRRLERGPQTSGVYARPAANGTIALLDPQAREVARLGAGEGLVAATGRSGGIPTWIVTGPDAAGALAAARALRAADLHGRFAVAVRGGAATGLPVEAGA